LSNHREAIAAMDFFTVPTITFGMLDCFFVIAHDRRRILHCRVAKHPTSAWMIQQLREAFPYDSAPRYLVFAVSTANGVFARHRRKLRWNVGNCRGPQFDTNFRRPSPFYRNESVSM